MALLRGTATFCAPLAVTTAWYHPSVTAVGVALQYFLASITYNSLQNPTQINKLLETAAISSLVTTSSTNRITRFLLGLVHTYAAISLSFRSQKIYYCGEASNGCLANAHVWGYTCFNVNCSDLVFQWLLCSVRSWRSSNISIVESRWSWMAPHA